MQATIEEPLVCHHICSYLSMIELDHLSTISRPFYEIITSITKNIKVIGTCNVYTNGPDDVYYLPGSDKRIDNMILEKEYEFFKMFSICSLGCMIVKPGVDYIIFDGYTGFFKDDSIEVYLNYLSDGTGTGEIAEIYNYIDNATCNYVAKKDISLREAIFDCVEVHKGYYGFIDQKEYATVRDEYSGVVRVECPNTIKDFLLFVEQNIEHPDTIEKIKFGSHLEIHLIDPHDN